MLVGYQIGKARYSFEDALSLSKDGLLPTRISYPLLCAITRLAKKGHASISVTGLLGCLRKTFLTQVVDYYDDPEGLIAPSYGTQLHKLIEDTEIPDWEHEQNLKVEFDGIVVSGTIDAIEHVDDDVVILHDFKFPSLPKYSSSDGDEIVFRNMRDYIQQVRCYSRMLEIAKEKTVKHADIHIFPICGKEMDNVMVHRVTTGKASLDLAEQMMTANAKALTSALKESKMPEGLDREWCSPKFCPLSIQEHCRGE